MEIDKAVIESVQAQAIAAVVHHAEAINSGDEQGAMGNLVAAEAFPAAARLYWHRALEVRPLVLVALSAQPPKMKVRNGRSQLRVFVQGQLAAALCRPVPFGFSVLFGLAGEQPRIAGRLPVHDLRVISGSSA